MKIKRFIMGMLVLFSLVPLYLVGGLLIVRNQRSIEKLQSENVEALSKTIILNIESYCDSQRLALQQIAQSKPVQQVLSAQGGTDADSISYTYMCDLLEEHKKYGESVVSVSVADRSGRIIASTEPELTGGRAGGQCTELPAPDDSVRESGKAEELPVSDDFVRNFGLDADNAFAVGSVCDGGDADGKNQVVVACHAVYRGTECIGYVAEEISTVYFDMLRSRMKLTKSDMICIQDGEGAVVTAGYFGSHAYSAKAQSVTDCEAYRRKWDKLRQTPGQRAADEGLIAFTDGGCLYITYSSGIEYTDWLIQVTIDMSSRDTAASSYRMLAVLSLLCLTLLLAGVNYFLTHKFTKPLDRMGKTLSEVQERSDYSLRIHVDKKGELGAIAEQINCLLACVQERSRNDEKRQKELQRNGELDPLTGIMNKKAIHEDMKALTARASELGIEIMVGFVDVDNFRDFNTRYGHQIGDEVLRHVAECLRRAVPGVVGRNGGDEFIFCMLNRRKEVRVEKVMDAFYLGLKEGVPIEGGETVAVTCSVGIARAKGSALDVAELEKEADAAMYEAKKKGKNTYSIRKCS